MELLPALPLTEPYHSRAERQQKVIRLSLPLCDFFVEDASIWWLITETGYLTSTRPCGSQSSTRSIDELSRHCIITWSNNGGKGDNLNYRVNTSEKSSSPKTERKQQCDIANGTAQEITLFTGTSLSPRNHGSPIQINSETRDDQTLNRGIKGPFPGWDLNSINAYASRGPIDPKNGDNV